MNITAMESTPGAIVTQLPPDLTTMTEVEKEVLREAYATYALLVLRGREMTIDEQLAVGEVLGVIIDQAATGQRWFNITNRDGGYDGELCYHADFSNSQDLLTGAILYASALPQGPTATLFAHTGMALEALSDEVREGIRGRMARHSGANGDRAADTPVRHRPEFATDPRAEHPIELAHPETGRPMLFISDMNTECIVDLPVEEGTAVLDELAAWVQQPRFGYRHEWQLHDMVVWDQIVMQHSRAAEKVRGERTLRRVSFTHPKFAAGCQEFFNAMGGRAGRSGSQKGVDQSVAQ